MRLLAALLGLTLVAGCTSGRETSATSPARLTPSASAAVPSDPTEVTPTPSPLSARSSSTSPSRSTATTSVRTSARTSAAPKPVSAPASTCASVSVLVLPGGAVPNTEIAGLLFTNTGATTCTLVGYPGVQLLRGGTAIGRPATPGSSARSSVRLAPGAQAESRLTDDVRDCTAAVSDRARVSIPGRPTSVVAPASLRACVLRVGPLGPPD